MDQTVADFRSDGSNEEAAAPASQDELDRLLSEFDASHNQAPAPVAEPGAPSPELSRLANEYAPQERQRVSPNQALVDRVDQIETARAMENFHRDLEATVNEVRGDLDPNIFNRDFCVTWLDNLARKNISLQHVWLNRENDPTAFRGAVNYLQREFRKTFRHAPDPQATADRDMVNAAVLRGSTTRPPEERPPNYGRLSNTEFRQDVRDKYGFDPGV